MPPHAPFLPAPSRCGSTPKCGRASSNAVNAPSPRASRSSCSCRPSSWAPCLTSAQSSGSPCWPMSAPSPPTRYPQMWGGWPHGSSPGGVEGSGQRGALQCHRMPRVLEGQGPLRHLGCPGGVSGLELSAAPRPALPLASTHPQLHHGHPGGQWQTGAGGQGDSCGASGGGEGPQPDTAARGGSCPKGGGWGQSP